MGVNFFKFGFVGGMDNYNGIFGQMDEVEYVKIGVYGVNSFVVLGQVLNEKFFFGLEINGGAVMVVWVEENLCDVIFMVLRNCEIYVISGICFIVRFFGGFGLFGNMCWWGDFVEQGYVNGVFMGGTFMGVPSSGGFQFVVSVLWDFGWIGQKGIKLERVQIIKGWVDKVMGESQEQVFDVVGKVNNLSVNFKNCKVKGSGYKDLCVVWMDLDFDKDENFFYYVWVLENLSCCWN